MIKRSIVCICIFFCIAMMSVSCKKGCGTCLSYGYTSGANNTYQGYSAQVCVNSFCTCANGYEGDSCQVYSINKYLFPSPNWQVSDACGNNPTYNVTMQASSSYPLTGVYISGLFNGGGIVTANISSTGGNQSTLIIPAQSVPTGVINSPCIGSYQVVSGLGKLTFVFDYTPNSTGIETNCSVTMYQIL